MAAPPALLIKAGLYAAENWRKVLPIAAGLFMTFFLLPFMALLFFLPSADTQKEEEYKRIAAGSHLDWVELIAYDTVRNTNDFAKVNPVMSALNFIEISYTQYEQVDEEEEYEEEVIAPISLNKPVIIKEPSYTSTPKKEVVKKTRLIKKWVKVKSETLTGYTAITMFLASNSYDINNSNLTIDKITKYCKQLDATDYFDIKVTPLTLLDIIDDWDDSERDWILDLLTVLYDKNGLFTSDPSNTREFYNPSGLSMANVKLSATAFKTANTNVLNGDTDINTIFAGRLAALTIDQGQKSLTITSGYRSIAEQQAIWDSTPPERRGKYVAKPGKSRHQYGLAADISGWLLYLDNSILIKYGLYKPMPYEDWHIEPIETSKNYSPQSSKSAGFQHFFVCQETVEYRSARRA